jgi:nitrite reductase/ring-hydroxylating ferredoxin subunit
MRKLQVGEKEEDSILIAKVDGTYYVVSNQCCHFGARTFL